MKQVIFVIFLSILSLSCAQYQDKTEDDFIKASERCFKSEKLSQDYKQRFDNFQFPDEVKVHKFLRCVWAELELWNDRTGFNVEHIADLYKDKANTEVLVPILSDCNRNERNEPSLRWCYRSFRCILNSRVGTWFKEDIEQKRKEMRQ